MDTKTILSIISSKQSYDEKKIFLKNLITKIKSNIPDGVKEGIYRYDLVPVFGYCIPDYDSFSLLSNIIRKNNIKSVLSIGSGVGFVEKTINILMAGEIVIATDPLLSHNADVNNINKWMDTEKITHVEALDKYDPDCLMMVWPSMENWPRESVELARNKKINYIIYIGETGALPCTGTYEMMEELDNKWEKIEEIYYTNFGDLNDYISVYRII